MTIFDLMDFIRCTDSHPEHSLTALVLSDAIEMILVKNNQEHRVKINYNEIEKLSNPQIYQRFLLQLDNLVLRGDSDA